MKKSDKLLLGGFLAGLLLLSTIHITLYAKYKSGDYTLYNEQEKMEAAMQSFRNIQFVSMRDVQGATIRFGDVAAVQKDDDHSLQYQQHGDTLVISGKSNANLNNNWDGMNISLPDNVVLTAANSSLLVRKTKNAKEYNCTIQLNQSNIIFSGAGLFPLGKVTIAAAGNSSVSFNGAMQVNILDTRLSTSSLDYGEGTVGQLSIHTDSASHISLQSKHLLKASITPITSN